MDGLEAVELKLSETISNNIFRIDAEHYKLIYLNVKQTLEKHKLMNLSSLVTQTISTGHTPSMKKEDFYGGIIKFIKTNNLRDNYIKPHFDHYLSQLGHDDIKRTQLKKDDIIVTIIGATQKIVGRATKIAENILPANINQNIALIRLDRDKINPDFINIYLNSYYGKQYFYYLSRQTEQVNLNCEEVGRVQVPIFSNTFQTKIEELVISSHQKLEDSKILYKQAEELLLKELDLLDFEPSREKVAIKTFKQSLGDSGRLDSEYYSKKYDEVIEHIKNVEFDRLDNIVNINKSIEPGSDAYQKNGIPFVRVSNLTKFALSTPDIHLSKNLFDDESLDKLQPKKDTILLSKDGTVGIAYNIKNETDIITSGAFLHLVIKKDNVLPEYLTLVLNSIVVQMQSERDAGGSIIKHWKPSEIEEVLIPIITEETQTQIEEKIKKSFALKEESKQLLKTAKRAVEIAIEEDEQKAMEFLHKTN